jgi:hypothetical protein
MTPSFYFLASIFLVFYFNIVLFNISIEWKYRHLEEQLKCHLKEQLKCVFGLKVWLVFSRNNHFKIQIIFYKIKKYMFFYVGTIKKITTPSS